jgi:hypothetical protein
MARAWDHSVWRAVPGNSQGLRAEAVAAGIHGLLRKFGGEKSLSLLNLLVEYVADVEAQSAMPNLYANGELLEHCRGFVAHGFRRQANPPGCRRCVGNQDR